MITKPKYKLNEDVWTVAMLGRNGSVKQCEVSEIRITEERHVEYTLTGDRFDARRAECDLFLTQEEAWAQWQKAKDERAKAQEEKMANDPSSATAAGKERGS